MVGGRVALLEVVVCRKRLRVNVSSPAPLSVVTGSFVSPPPADDILIVAEPSVFEEMSPPPHFPNSGLHPDPQCLELIPHTPSHEQHSLAAHRAIPAPHRPPGWAIGNAIVFRITVYGLKKLIMHRTYNSLPPRLTKP